MNVMLIILLVVLGIATLLIEVSRRRWVERDQCVKSLLRDKEAALRRQCDLAAEKLIAQQQADTWRGEHQKINSQLQDLRLELASRRVTIIRREGMNEEQMAVAFRQAPGTMLMKAIEQLLDGTVVDCLNRASDPALSDKEMHTSLGGSNALLDFKASLQTWIDAAVREKEEEKAEKS